VARTRVAEVNEEDEVGVFVPSGQPGVRQQPCPSLYLDLTEPIPPFFSSQLWFAGGNFGMSRAFSKQLVTRIPVDICRLFDN
jgi:hypothetical protein